MKTTLSNKIDSFFEDSKSQATLQNLIASTEMFDKGTRRKNASLVRLTGLKLDPYVGTKMLRIFSSSENNHEQVIEAYNVEFSDVRDNMHPLQVNMISGGKQKTFYYSQLGFGSTRVSVRCTCSDFIYTFAYYDLHKLNALTYAQLKPYVRKTIDRPSRNEDQRPGMCKHLLSLVNFLGQNGVFR